MVVQAFEFVLLKHAGQVRHGGDAVISHVLRVARAAEQYADEHKMRAKQEKILVVSALLHDILENTQTSTEEVANLFGSEITGIIQALSHRSRTEPEEDYLRRVKNAGRMALLVKRFDRLDNVRSLPKENLAKYRSVLPKWREIDPEGAVQVEQALMKYD
jgi:(p)ppGpp synthase/HD superfamily hydrolase